MFYSNLGYAFVQLPDLLFFIYDYMKSRCLDDKNSATHTITVMESDERRSASGEISSSGSDLPEDQSNLVLKATASFKTYNPLSIENKIVQLKATSFEDAKELKMILFACYNFVPLT